MGRNTLEVFLEEGRLEPKLEGWGERRWREEKAHARPRARVRVGSWRGRRGSGTAWRVSSSGRLEEKGRGTEKDEDRKEEGQEKLWSQDAEVWILFWEQWEASGGFLEEVSQGLSLAQNLVAAPISGHGKTKVHTAATKPFMTHYLLTAVPQVSSPPAPSLLTHCSSWSGPLLLLKCARPSPTSGPSHMLFPVWRTLSPDLHVSTWVWDLCRHTGPHA